MASAGIDWLITKEPTNGTYSPQQHLFAGCGECIVQHADEPANDADSARHRLKDQLRFGGRSRTVDCQWDGSQHRSTHPITAELESRSWVAPDRRWRPFPGKLAAQPR